MSLSKYEKETIITFNEEDPDATIYTHNQAMKNRLAELSKKHPEDFVLLHKEGKSQTYRFPKSLLNIRALRGKRTMTEEEKKEAVERLQKGKEQEAPKSPGGFVRRKKKGKDEGDE